MKFSEYNMDVVLPYKYQWQMLMVMILGADGPPGLNVCPFAQAFHSQL